MKTYFILASMLFLHTAFSQEDPKNASEPVAIPLPPPPSHTGEYHGSDMEEQPEIVYFPDEEATFPGGTSEMMKFIQETIVYPQKAIIDSIQGKVYISAVVNIDGTISDVRVDRGVNKVLNDEAIRVMYAMPKWIPGRNSKDVVKTRIRMPFVFTLD